MSKFQRYAAHVVAGALVLDYGAQAVLSDHFKTRCVIRDDERCEFRHGEEGPHPGQWPANMTRVLSTATGTVSFDDLPIWRG